MRKFIILSLVILLSGCAGQLTNLTNDIRDRRQQLVNQSERFVGKYKAIKETYVESRETYIDLREIVKEKCKEKGNDKICKKAQEIDTLIVKIDKRVREFHSTVEQFHSEAKKLNSDIKMLEQKAKKADKAWKDIVTILRNLSTIGVKVI